MNVESNYNVLFVLCFDYKFRSFDGGFILFLFDSVSNLCGVIFTSRKGQLVLLMSLLEIMEEAEEELKKQYLDFTKDLIEKNNHMLGDDARAILKEVDIDVDPAEGV